MSTKSELRILKALLKLLNKPDKGVKNFTVFMVSGYAAGVSAIAVIYYLLKENYLSVKAGFIFAVMAGMVFAFGTFYRIARSQWKVTAAHIDKSSIEKRIKDLEV